MTNASEHRYNFNQKMKSSTLLFVMDENTAVVQ